MFVSASSAEPYNAADLISLCTLLSRLPKKGIQPHLARTTWPNVRACPDLLDLQPIDSARYGTQRSLVHVVEPAAVALSLEVTVLEGDVEDATEPKRTNSPH